MAAAEAPGLAGNSADRTRDVRTITTVTEVLSANPETTPLLLRLGPVPGHHDVVANSTPADFEIVLKHDEIRFDSLNFEIVGAFFGREGLEGFADCGAHGVNGSSGSLSDEMLEFGKDLFDGVQVG